MTTLLVGDLYDKIEKLADSERVTKALLGELSRELLEYWQATGDVQPINVLLGVLTPMNKQTASLFFAHFVPHHFSEEECKFGKKFGKAAKYTEKNELITAFLATENTIWDWAAEHVQIKAKKFDLNAQLKSILTRVHKIEEGEKEYEELNLNIDAEVVQGLMALLTQGVQLEAEASEAEDNEAEVEVSEAA